MAVEYQHRGRVEPALEPRLHLVNAPTLDLDGLLRSGWSGFCLGTLVLRHQSCCAGCQRAGDGPSAHAARRSGRFCPLAVAEINSRGRDRDFETTASLVGIGWPE